MASSHMNAGLKQQIPTIRRRCADYKPNGRRGASRVNIDHNSHEEVLCHRHKPQEKDSRKTVRHCDGTTKAGNACGVRVANTSIFTPTFCARHSAREPHYVFCFGVANAATNQRCKTRIRWQEPYFQFCQQHASQAQSFKQAVAVLPNDLVEEVTSYLTPIDCFALALTNKACYQLVRALRSNKQHASTHARQHQLHLFRSDQHIRTDFSLVKLSSSSSLSLRLPRFSIASGNALMTQGISSAWRQAATTVHAFPCACYESASNAHELEELWSSDQARGYINIGNVLLRALTTAPWIFTTFTDRPWCIRCKTALTDEDENSWQRKPLEMLGDHKLGRREKQALRKRTLLCRSCVNPQNTRAYMTWCSKCFGVPDVFAVARGYWNTRPRTNALEV